MKVLSYVAGNIGRVLLQVIIGIYYARVLGPESYGLIAMFWIASSLVRLICELGLNSSIIYHKLGLGQLNFILLIQVLFASFLVACAMLVCSLFYKFDLSYSLLLLSFVPIVFQFPCNILQIRAEINRSYRLISTNNILSIIIGQGIVGCLAVANGFNVEGVLLGIIVQYIVYISLYFRMGYRFGNNLELVDIKSLIYSLRNLVSSFVNWMYSNLDSVVVGIFVGTANLGVYNRANTLLATYMNSVTNPFQSRIFVEYSNNLHTSSEKYLDSAGILSMLMFPVFWAMVPVSDIIINVIFGPKWTDSSPVLAILCYFYPLISLLSMSGPLMLAKNVIKFEIYSQFILVGIWLNLIYLISPTNMTEMIQMIVFLILARFIILTSITLRILDINILNYVRSIIPGVLLGILMYWISTLINAMENSSSAIYTMFYTILIQSIVFFPLSYLYYRKNYK